MSGRKKTRRPQIYGLAPLWMTPYFEPPAGGSPSPVSRITDLINAGFSRKCHVIPSGCDATLKPLRDSPSPSTRRRFGRTPDVVSEPSADAKSSVSDVNSGENPQRRFEGAGWLIFPSGGSPRARNSAPKPRPTRPSAGPAEVSHEARFGASRRGRGGLAQARILSSAIFVSHSLWTRPPSRRRRRPWDRRRRPCPA
jgi:hypothetical protein